MPNPNFVSLWDIQIPPNDINFMNLTQRNGLLVEMWFLMKGEYGKEKKEVQQSTPFIMGNEDVQVPPLPTSSSGRSSPIPPSSPSSSSGESSKSQSSPSSSQKVQSLNEIYQRISIVAPFAKFSLLSSIQVEPSVYEEVVK